MKNWLNFITVLLPVLICTASCSLLTPADREEWHTKPLTYETLGTDVNNCYYVVGLPKNCICQFMASQPAYSENGHDFFYVSGHPKMFIEIEYSDDGRTIRRFRFIEKLATTLKEDRFGGWQTKNLRQHWSDFTTGISIVKLDWTRDPFKVPFATLAFTSKAWKSDKEHRSWFLFDIAHDYPLIGMSHSEIIAVLGPADYVPNAQSKAHSEFDYGEKYILSRGCLGIYAFLEIACFFPALGAQVTLNNALKTASCCFEAGNQYELAEKIYQRVSYKGIYSTLATWQTRSKKEDPQREAPRNTAIANVYGNNSLQMAERYFFVASSRMGHDDSDLYDKIAYSWFEKAEKIYEENHAPSGEIDCLSQMVFIKDSPNDLAACALIKKAAALTDNVGEVTDELRPNYNAGAGDCANKRR